MKWGKEEYVVAVEAGTTTVDFKSQVAKLTQVPVDRQKYLGFAGGMLKDTDDFMGKVAKLKAGAKITLIGTAEGAELKAPTEKTVFEEDLTAEEKAKILKEKKAEILPAGIDNLGNTCYMNACLQCMNHIPEIRQAMVTYSAPSTGDADAALTTQLKSVTQMLTSTTGSIKPIAFWMALRQRFPRFAEMQNGRPMQQDADECLRGLLTVLSGSLRGAGEGGSKIDELFGFRMKSTLKNLECDEEPAQSSTEENQRVLMCHLGTQNEPVSLIHQGVALSMKEHIEKQSPTLGRNAQYQKSSAMDSMPPYLVVQFARFGYQGANEWAGTTASKVKLTRKCAFSKQFDVLDCASDELKKVLNVGRLKKKEKDDAEMERIRQERLGKKSDSKSGGDAKPAEAASAARPNDDVEMPAATASSGGDGDVEMTPGEGQQDYDTGYYELVAIVSHKGRTADGGHYVGWTKHKTADGKELKEDQWILFDDDEVSFVNWNDMVGLGTDLQGGKADTQIAYISIYKKVTVKA